MKKSKKGKFLKVLAMPALLLCAGLSLTACGEPAHTHDFQTNYSCNQTHHWHDCSGCEEEKDKALHIDEDNNDFCDVCNYEMAHTHHQFANTWSSDATKHWKECACGEKSQEANHAHNTWQNNETQHWQQCECGHTTTPANHNWGTGIVTTQPQIGVPGERTFTCECGKTKTEAIPALTKPAAMINGMSEITLDKEYDGNVVLAPATLTDTNTDAGSDITFEWYQGATKLATAPKDAGTYIFKAIVAETANFARVEEGKQFTISAKEITVNWTAPANLEYSRTEKMASATAVGLCGADTATIGVTPENNNINPGPVTFTAVSQNPNYVVKTDSNANKKTYTIAPKTLTNVVIVKEYDGDDGNDGYISLSAQLNESHGVFEGDLVYVSMTSMAGKVPMGNGNNWVINTPTTASVVGTHANYYSIAPSEVKLQRIPKKITISSSNLNFDYTGSTTFTYTLTEFDGLINSALGEQYNGGTVEFTVANANVSAGAQTPTQIGFTNYGCTGLVMVNGFYLYQIVNTPTVTINKGIYTDGFQFYTAEYNGSTTLDFEISTSSGKIYLTGDVANKNVTGDYQDITNIRLTQGTELPNNYRDVSVADGQIRIGKRQLTIIYETVYTGSEITIPTLTRQNSTMNGLIAGEEVQITNIQFEDTEDKINVGAPVVGGIVDYQPKSLKDGFTLAGDDCDNYNLSSGHLYVVIKPKEKIDAINIDMSSEWQEGVQVLNRIYNTTDTTAIISGWYTYENNAKGDEFTGELVAGNSYYIEIDCYYNNENYAIAETAPITVNENPATIISKGLKNVRIGYVVNVEVRLAIDVTLTAGTSVSEAKSSVSCSTGYTPKPWGDIIEIGVGPLSGSDLLESGKTYKMNFFFEPATGYPIGEMTLKINGVIYTATDSAIHWQENPFNVQFDFEFTVA